MTAIAPVRRQDSLLRLLRVACGSRAMRRELVLAVLAGAGGCGAGVALLAISGFLLARASQHPNIVAPAGLTAVVSGLTLWGVLLLGVAATGAGSLGRVLQLGQAKSAADRIAAVADPPDPVRRPDHPLPPPERPVTISLRGLRSVIRDAPPTPFGILILTSRPDGGSPCPAASGSGSPWPGRCWPILPMTWRDWTRWTRSWCSSTAG